MIVDMYLALRDIAFARGRFALMTGVVGLITLLLIMLSGLTGGLGKQNTSALESLNPTAVVFSGDKASFSESSITTDDLRQFPGSVPLGVVQTRIASDSNAGAGAVLALPVGTDVPGGTIPDNGILVSDKLVQDLGVGVGDTINMNAADVVVDGIVPDEFYSHSPVVWAPTSVWQSVAHGAPGVVGTVALVGQEVPDQAGYTVTSLRGSFNGLTSYSSEQGSLRTMQGFLYAISALVTVAFLTVWTIQRTRDLSILKALGASGRYLLRDALSQAALVLGVGAGAGLVLGLGLGIAAANVLPFELSWMTVALPAFGIYVLGMLGALLATRKVAATDPLLALGGNA